MIIQTMSWHDLEIIKPIILSEFDDFWTINILEQNFNNPNAVYFVAKKEDDTNPDSILGFVALLNTPIDIEISNIVVRKQYRRTGVGQQLLNKVFEYALELNKELITLEVNEHNSSAISLYLKNDFEEVYRRKKYYKGIDDAIFMKKELHNGK